MTVTPRRYNCIMRRLAYNNEYVLGVTLKQLLGKTHHLKGLTVRFHLANEPEMIEITKTLENVTFPNRNHKGLTKTERVKGIIADVQIGNEHVYLLYLSHLPLYVLFDQLIPPKTPANLADVLIYEKSCYWCDSQTGKLLAEAIQKRVRPSIYALLQATMPK